MRGMPLTGMPFKGRLLRGMPHLWASEPRPASRPCRRCGQTALARAAAPPWTARGSEVRVGGKKVFEHAGKAGTPFSMPCSHALSTWASAATATSCNSYNHAPLTARLQHATHAPRAVGLVAIHLKRNLPAPPQAGPTAAPATRQEGPAGAAAAAGAGGTHGKQREVFALLHAVCKCMVALH